ncbi:hypothetical protein HNR02_004727 [Amycolatopsis endophytica]|uniref:KAP NTPase domain-containing protein n=1 Tax=Amycolatopsis endophytica TaxID=860233 RepID=A0A853B9G1_9PSEU|nr:P-loop NTPase fold protein [Amycolatopsis endophytica]NYI91404.1 hypothetical protein [Amycolatopsis endophytica]
MAGQPGDQGDTLRALADSHLPVGYLEEIECLVVRTERPWELPIDTIVVSVGATLGYLGESMMEWLPSWPLRSAPFDRITAESPYVMDLPRATDETRLVRAVLATAHDAGHDVMASADMAGAATFAAIDAAVRSGATAIGLPLLGTGRLALPRAAVADAVVSAVARVLRTPVVRARLSRLVFFDRHTAGEEALRQSLGRVVADAPHGMADLAGGVSADLVDPNAGLPLSRDQLDFAPYVSMLATVIADRRTPLPLSAGIFGEWGSGKSYFMALLRGEVDRLASFGGPAYHREIVQIGFNAWHYADTNLWASLGEEIFRQLAGPERDEAGLLRAELAERLEQRRALEREIEQAREAATALQTEVDQALGARRTTAADLVRALHRSPRFREETDALWRDLGVDDEIERAGLLLAESGEVRGHLKDIGRTAKGRRGQIAAGTALTVLLGLAAVAAFAPDVRDWLAAAGTVAAAVSTWGLWLAGRARAGLAKLGALSQELRSGLDDVAGEEPALAAKVAALRRAEADQRVAQARLEDVVTRVGELGTRLATTTPGHRLYTFLAERAGSGAYTRHLGLVSTIRKDLTELVRLMAQWREHPGGEARTPIDRIVLYIDDLDRCSPRQVVEVIEAVHLLLALDLFVVVIGVDPRWLLRSLCSHYDEILGGEQGVTPEDYLEKIINVPLALPGMSGGSLTRLLRSLVDDESPAPDAPTVPEPRTGAAPAITVEAGSELDRRPAATPPAPVPLTEPELRILTALDPLVKTPRKAKRLFNLYRMVRATRDLSPAARFLGENDDDGEYQAVAVLLGVVTGYGPRYEEFAASLARAPESTTWPDFVDGLPEIHSGLRDLPVTLPDLSCFRLWAPRIRRFSYFLGG